MVNIPCRGRRTVGPDRRLPPVPRTVVGRNHPGPATDTGGRTERLESGHGHGCGRTSMVLNRGGHGGWSISGCSHSRPDQGWYSRGRSPGRIRGVRTRPEKETQGHDDLARRMGVAGQRSVARPILRRSELACRNHSSGHRGRSNRWTWARGTALDRQRLLHSRPLHERHPVANGITVRAVKVFRPWLAAFFARIDKWESAL